MVHSNPCEEIADFQIEIRKIFRKRSNKSNPILNHTSKHKLKSFWDPLHKCWKQSSLEWVLMMCYCKSFLAAMFLEQCSYFSLSSTTCWSSYWEHSKYTRKKLCFWQTLSWQWDCPYNTLIRIYIYLRLRFSAVTASFNKYSNRQKTRKILSQKQNTDRANIFHGSILRNMFFAYLIMKIHAPTINIVVSIPPAGTNWH